VIVIKNKRHQSEWGRLSPFLREVCEYYAGVREVVLGLDTIVTCVGSTYEEDQELKRKSTTHRDLRAVDFRIDRDRLDLENKVRDIVNLKFPTGISTMPRIAPLRHGTAPHGHVQETRAENAVGRSG